MNPGRGDSTLTDSRGQRKKALRLIANARLATLRFDILPKTFERRARIQRALQTRVGAGERTLKSGEHQHVRRQLEREIEHRSRPVINVSAQ